jgi:hypothetical protein
VKSEDVDVFYEIAQVQQKLRLVGQTQPSEKNDLIATFQGGLH